MKNSLYPFLFILSVVTYLLLGSCSDEPVKQENLVPGLNKFVTLPPSPTTKEMVFMVTYDCKYNQLASVTVKGYDIEVKKRFNGQLKWPCILQYDTIPLGRLNAGTYLVTLLVIDTNPFVKDSISVKESLSIKVGR